MNHRANKILGTWKMVSATVDPDGAKIAPFGQRPAGLMVFDATGHFVEVLSDRDVPAFEAGSRDAGTPEENAAAVNGALGQYGTYTVDEDGDFAGNTIVGSTFPNWNGMHRDSPQLRMIVDGQRMTEELRDPGQPLIQIVFEKVR